MDHHIIVRETPMRVALFPTALAVAVALLVWVDRSPSDAANQASLLVLLVTAGLLGFARPGRAWLPGLIIGGSLAVAHAVYAAAGISLSYRSEPGGWVGAASLLLLIIPAMLAAYAGAGIARLIRRDG